jgi:hypothetical protein
LHNGSAGGGQQKFYGLIFIFWGAAIHLAKNGVLERDFLSLLLPAGLLEHFLVTEVKELGDVSTRKLFYEIHLEEQNELFSRPDASDYESKGFTEVTLQDFPIRGKSVYLVIRRRRWRHKQNPKDIVRNDYSFVAEGSRLTKELADFLKGTGRYQGGYD